MDNEQRMSREVIEQKLREGAAVMDAGGETIGATASYDMQEGYMEVSGGTLFPANTRIPLSAIGDTGASGLYLTGHRDDLLQQYGGRDASSRSADLAAVTDASRSGQPVGAHPLTGGDAPSGASDHTDRGSRDTLDRPAARGDTADALTSGVRATTTPEDIRVPVYEEELVVGKRQEEEGRVHLHKEVVQEQESIPVTLRHEEVTVERVRVTEQGQTSKADLRDAFTDETIEIPVMGEEAIVGKQAHVVEEVRLHKDVTQQQEQVSDTVRKERVVVDGVEERLSGADTPHHDGDRLTDR